MQCSRLHSQTFLGISNAQYGHTQFHPLKGYRTLHANAFMAFQSHWALQPLQLENIFASKGAVKVERIWN